MYVYIYIYIYYWKFSVLTSFKYQTSFKYLEIDWEERFQGNTFPNLSTQTSFWFFFHFSPTLNTCWLSPSATQWVCEAKLALSESLRIAIDGVSGSPSLAPGALTGTSIPWAAPQIQTQDIWVRAQMSAFLTSNPNNSDTGDPQTLLGEKLEETPEL